MNKLRKEINRLCNEEMSNIYINVTTEAFSKLLFSGFRKFTTRSSFWGAPTHAKYH